eukprot:2310100-Rhodomonas_salina.1
MTASGVGFCGGAGGCGRADGCASSRPPSTRQRADASAGGSQAAIAQALRVDADERERNQKDCIEQEMQD